MGSRAKEKKKEGGVELGGKVMHTKIGRKKKKFKTYLRRSINKK
jgi:hypothetical protein